MHRLRAASRNRHIPRQEFMQPLWRRVFYPGEHRGQVGFRVVAVHLGRLDDGQEVGDALAALVRAGEQPVFAPDPDGPHRPLGNVIIDLDAAVIDVNPKGFPAGQGVAHCLRELVLLRKGGQRLSDPRLQIIQDRPGMVLPVG